MYVFSDDEEHLLFQDGLGTTRLSFPKSVKAIANTPGHENTTLSRSKDSTQVLLTQGGLDKATIYEFPSLKAIHRYGKHENLMAAILPDGGGIVVPDFGMHSKVLPKPDEKPIFGKAKPKNYALGATEPFKALPPSEPLSLGGTTEDLERPMRPFQLSANGQFSMTFTEPPEVCLGTLISPKEIEVKRRIPLTDTGRIFLDVYAVGDEYVVSAWNGKSTRIFILKENDRSQEDFNSLFPPQISEEWIAWQPSPETVVRRSRTTSEEQHFDIAAISERARVKNRNSKSWVEPPANNGRGSILIGNQRLLFVPWHGETIVDLQAEIEVSRKLPTSPLRLPLLQAIEEERQKMSESSFAIWLSTEDRSASRSSTAFYLANTYPPKKASHSLRTAPKRWQRLLEKHGKETHETATINMVFPREIPR